MIITISKIAPRTKTSKAGKKYQVVEVTGNKWASEEEWTTAIFKNKTDLLDMLDEFGPGDVANFKFVKDGQWPELNEICEPSKEDLDKAQETHENGGYKPNRGGKRTSGKSNAPTSGGMSKAEWAAKDKKTAHSIARAVAIKLANDNTKVGATPSSIIKQAVKFIPFLLGEDEILFDKVKDPEDALDPPVED